MKKSKLPLYLSVLISLIILGLSASAQNAAPKPATIDVRNIVGKWRIVGISANNFSKQSGSKAVSVDKPVVPVVDKSEVIVDQPLDSVKKPAPPQPKTNPPQTDLQKKDRSQLYELKKSATALRGWKFEFFADKTGVKTSGDKKEKLTWKTNKKNILLIKNRTTKEQTEMEILKLTSDTLQAAQIANSGKIYVFYLKEK